MRDIRRRYPVHFSLEAVCASCPISLIPFRLHWTSQRFKQMKVRASLQVCVRHKQKNTHIAERLQIFFKWSDSTFAYFFFVPFSNELYFFQTGKLINKTLRNSNRIRTDTQRIVGLIGILQLLRNVFIMSFIQVIIVPNSCQLKKAEFQWK